MAQFSYLLVLLLLTVMTTDSIFEAFEVGFDVIASALHLHSKLLTDTQCLLRFQLVEGKINYIL